ncbi:unnamed protein product [Gongylonema pulchrum]|uniref:PARP catalytic domain-containing protein n=1 Tax=Gongylonema pulchrum TaxID=637853 RepID=A0A183EEX4_9BILA|nr:unnamed protein product [Gongylonema pulchrum]
MKRSSFTSVIRMVCAEAVAVRLMPLSGFENSSLPMIDSDNVLEEYERTVESLYILDGLESDLTLLNPDDLMTQQILQNIQITSSCSVEAIYAGIYFADVFAKSENYCTPSERGSKYMLLCQVALGEIYYGVNSSVVRADAQNKLTRYDTLKPLFWALQASPLYRLFILQLDSLFRLLLLMIKCHGGFFDIFASEIHFLIIADCSLALEISVRGELTDIPFSSDFATLACSRRALVLVSFESLICSGVINK